MPEQKALEVDNFLVSCALPRASGTSQSMALAKKWASLPASFFRENTDDTWKLSNSRAFCSVISVQQLVAAGSWRSTNTFAKRYFVPVLKKAKGSVVVARSRCSEPEWIK